MFKLSLCDYNDVYILVKGTISIAPLLPQAVNPNKSNKEVLFKNFASFTDCISKINNTQRYNAKDIDVVMPMYNLTKCSNNYLQASGILWQYYRDEPFLDDNGAITDFPAANNNSALFISKQKTAGGKKLVVKRMLK